LERLTVGYCRVSTASGEQLAALTHQRSLLERSGCDLILADVESGLNTQRENYQQLWRLVESGAVGQVLASEFSRLGRDANESDAFVRLCDQHQTVCRTMQDGALTMATPEDLLLTRLKGSLSQGESMRISQRVRRGLEEGRRLGKPMRKPCWGYRLNGDRTAFEPDPDQFPVARRFLAALKASDWRMMPTLKQFNGEVPFRSCRGVRAWVLTPTLRGGVGYQQMVNHEFKQVLWDRHEALLSHADHAEFLAMTAHNRTRWGINTKAKPRALTSLCKCAECGCTLKYISGRTIKSLRCNGDTCSQLFKGTREEVIIGYAMEQIAKRAIQVLAAAATEGEPLEVLELREQIAKLKGLGDADLVPVIQAKEQRMEALKRQPQYEPELLGLISDPQWASWATYDEVRTMVQRLVIDIQITRQVPSAIRLRL
jgi:DNA invertase Pin-like site-specific DNA recombinase